MQISTDELQELDVLLYARRKLGIKYFHCAWFMGWIWGMPVNYESRQHGPEIEEWAKGDIPKYALRLKETTAAQRLMIKEGCRQLKDKKYDWIYFIGHYLNLNHPRLIRCDENIEIPLRFAGIDPKRTDRKPDGFLKSSIFTVYEVKEFNQKP